MSTDGIYWTPHVIWRVHSSCSKKAKKNSSNCSKDHQEGNIDEKMQFVVDACLNDACVCFMQDRPSRDPDAAQTQLRPMHSLCRGSFERLRGISVRSRKAGKASYQSFLHDWHHHHPMSVAHPIQPQLTTKAHPQTSLCVSYDGRLSHALVWYKFLGI